MPNIWSMINKIRPFLDTSLSEIPSKYEFVALRQLKTAKNTI